MKNQVISITAVTAALILSSGFSMEPAAAAGQDRRTVETRVADILARVPATSTSERDRMAGEVLALGEEGIVELAGRLVPAGGGDDAAVRFALNGAVVRASRSGAGEERALVERALVRALGSAPDREVKEFILSQMQLVGGDEAVGAAAPLLLDAALVEPATQLMLAVKGAAARQAVVAALDSAAGAPLVTLARAAGELEGPESIRRLAEIARSPDVSARKAALASLARIASPASYNVLADAARRVGFRYDEANATGALVEYARRLGERGDLRACERVCRLVIDKCDDDRLPTRSAALAILVENRGHDVLADLMKAVDSPDKAFRNAALLQAEGLTGIAPIRQWAAKAQKAAPERRAEIISMLGRQGDTRSLPFIRLWLDAGETGVAIAAAEALARIAGTGSSGELIALLRTWPADRVQHLAGILTWTLDERNLDPLVAILDEVPPASRAAAAGVVAARNGRRFSDRIFALTADEDPGVRFAAFSALEGVANPSDVPRLLEMFESAEEVETVECLQRALAAAATMQPQEAGARLLVEAMQASRYPDRIVAVLPRLGGSRALSAVVARFDGSDPDGRAAAFEALVQWKDHEAAGRLFQVRASGDPTRGAEALAAFVRQISSSSLPADQRLLHLRKALPLAESARERQMILGAIGRVKTFGAFMLAMSLLDVQELSSGAAAAAMRIALPTAGGRDGLSGRLVREGLERVLDSLSGPESDYDRQNIEEYLAAMPPDEGFVPIFNGKDLAGWKGLVENPIARAKMSREELEAKQAEADARMRTNWGVRDGTVVFNGNGDNICTVKDYGDFEMLVDWRITSGGDSGIYLRGTPQVQIWDTARTDVGAEVGSGGLYNNQKHPSRPLVVADNPLGEWNTLRITMIGEKVTVFLNGVKVVDNVTMENYWDRKRPIFPRGPIELQAHGTDLAFRDIYVREIAEGGGQLAEEETAEGFEPLFNGRDLDGWIGNTGGYKVENGALVYDPESGDRTNLYTAGQYGDFDLRFEFQLTPGANSGIGIRAPLEGDAAYVGMEVQVLDDTAPVYASLQPYQYHGSVYGVIAAKRGFLKPVGEWNSEEIMVRGSLVRITLNGEVIVEGDILESSRNGTLDGQPHPGLLRDAGHIGLLSHDTVVRFRKIRIREHSRQ